jgi:hypothetical protein
MFADLNNTTFQDEIKARAWLEAELWPNGPVCPHCGTLDEATGVQGESHRGGSLHVQRLPQAIHRDGRHAVRT